MDIQVGETYILKRGPDGEDCCLPHDMFKQMVVVTAVFESSVEFKVIDEKARERRGFKWYAYFCMLGPVRGPW